MSSAHFLFPKSMFRLPPRALSLDFIFSNILSIGAISGQYGAQNLTRKSSSFIMVWVINDEWVLALSKIRMRDFWIFTKCLLMISSNSFRKNQNFSLFIVSRTTIAVHSPVFHVARMRLALPFSLLLII